MSEKDGVNVTSGCNAEDPNVIDNKKQQGTEDVIIEQPIVCDLKVSSESSFFSKFFFFVLLCIFYINFYIFL